MAQLRTIIFDLGNVIIPFDFKRGYSALAAHVDYPAEEISPRIRATGLVERFETGLIEPRPFVDELTRAIGAPITYEQFCELWTSIFLEHTLIPIELMRELKKSYRMVVLSNTNAIHIGMVREQYPILGEFDQLVLSHEVKAMKPSPLIYSAAVEAAQARPDECFFTDDIAAYVEGARAFGIDAEQFLGYDKLLTDLRARGVSV
ncbi:MAG: HAD family phosphatase [Acidobacteria bacterium]|nr:HAD family phosphatase [Acidobacteriota bacterium]